ncbi:MAG: hypothetical protein IPI88_08295 [Chitinophagaceae bacterium]|nr:hypothetical protein [Chitinophagaceae bacterium]
MNYFSRVSVPIYTFETGSVLFVLAGVFSTYKVIGLPFFNLLMMSLLVRINWPTAPTVSSAISIGVTSSPIT